MPILLSCCSYGLEPKNTRGSCRASGGGVIFRPIPACRYSGCRTPCPHGRIVRCLPSLSCKNSSGSAPAAPIRA